MDHNSMRQVENDLIEYLQYCFGGLGRSERRDALGHYVRGLLLDGERKSVEPMAQRIAPAGKAQAYRQRMQEAVCVADWDQAIVFRRVAERAYQMLPEIAAWVLDDTGFPKKGRMSVGVQRQYSGTLGRIDNCQVAPSLHLASEAAGICIGMRLYLPEPWLQPHRRDRGKIPDAVSFKEKWRIGLDLIDEAGSWGLDRRPVVADAGYGDITEFRDELVRRELEYVVGINKTIVVWPAGTRFEIPSAPAGSSGRPRTRVRPVGDVLPLSVEDFACQPSIKFRRVTWRQGTRGEQHGRFAFARVMTAHKHKTGAPPGAEQTLIMEWPARAERPTTFYLSNLPAKTSKKRLVYLAKVRWRIEQDYQEMKGELGLDHFEGRSWRGFHHHVACVAAAYAFLALNRALFPPDVRAHDGTQIPPTPSAGDHSAPWALSTVRANESLASESTVAHLIR